MERRINNQIHQWGHRHEHVCVKWAKYHEIGNSSNVNYILKTGSDVADFEQPGSEWSLAWQGTTPDISQLLGLFKINRTDPSHKQPVNVFS